MEALNFQQDDIQQIVKKRMAKCLCLTNVTAVLECFVMIFTKLMFSSLLQNNICLKDREVWKKGLPSPFLSRPTA